MTDNISREALLKMIGTMPSSPITDREERLIRAFISTVENFPAADVREVVRGFNVVKDYSSLFECSVCGWSDSDTTTGDTRTYNFCPNCGAKMEER